ncbi:MAG: ABC transporter ATP-binding protein [Erysipelotrichaceae bacterium]|nr:ABC transporter ATP-binding protein [Erysipelotrichaceae bacterium]
MPPGGRNRRPVEKAKDFKGTVGKLLSYLKPFYIMIIIVMILSVGSMIFSVVGPRISGRATTLLYQGIVSKYSGGEGIDFAGIGKILLTLLAIYVVSAIFSYLSGIIMARVSQRISYNLRNQITAKINKLPLKYFDAHTHGEVISRVTNDVDNISFNLSNVIRQLLSSVVSMVGISIMMLSISLKMSLIAFLTVPLSAMVAAFVVKKSQRYFFRQQSILGQLNGHIEEMYSGHNVIKAYNYEEDSIKEFDRINKELQESNFKARFFGSVTHPVNGLIGNLGYVAVCLLGGFEMIHGRLDIGNIQAFIQYVRNFNQPINQASQTMNTIQTVVASAERVFEILDAEEEVKDTETPAATHDEQGNYLIKGNVAFENVRFGYDPDQIVIKDFSMYIPEGKQVAIVGPTGAGKTTIVKLLMRFYELNGGTIYVDGKDIKDYRREDLRDIFGMVLQDAWLQSGTIMENIRYGKPDATDEEVYKACKEARVDHFIRTLENGYNTEINEETSNISLGQKQLLTIARAFLKNPKILILDEATSSVDTRTEQLIQDGMEELMKGRTSFVIAHRLSTIRNSDIILVMDKGDIVEVGDHQSLLAKGGFYATLYNSQCEG